MFPLLETSLDATRSSELGGFMKVLINGQSFFLTFYSLPVNNFAPPEGPSQVGRPAEITVSPAWAQPSARQPLPETASSFAIIIRF
jgi:hypothetical protein